MWFFDSVGYRPPKEIIKWMEKFCKFFETKNCPFEKINVQYNPKQHQHKDRACGVYSINFIRRCLRGVDFNDTSKHIILDDVMDGCRTYYFRSHFLDGKKVGGEK